MDSSCIIINTHTMFNFQDKKNKQTGNKKAHKKRLMLLSTVHVVVELLVDDPQVVLSHDDSPSIVYNTIEDNGNCDKINRPPIHNMHTSHFHVKTDQYQSKQLSHMMHLT